MEEAEEEEEVAEEVAEVEEVMEGPINHAVNLVKAEKIIVKVV